jgi:hypothetical protein
MGASPRSATLRTRAPDKGAADMTRRLYSIALLALLALALITGCSGRGARQDAVRAPRTAEDSLSCWRLRADSLEAAVAPRAQAGGRLDPAGGSATWAAWFDSGAVRVVHETVDLGTHGSGSNRYYYERGKLRLTVERGMVPAGTTQQLVALERAMLFDDLGRLVAATMKLDSVKTWVSGDEATAVLGRARRLRASAEEARAGQGAPAPPEGGIPAKR